ncbi:hypothetical protein NPIL_21511 [Nephila pilipes]|uniref:Uncharacterized protein n=1 Tax=Nephila pilipes TaxID=299642 RepID=A0A8X6Q291_NEPPI|nr:hypothetical protein NPIL_21511 [Nephila pilipes]
MTYTHTAATSVWKEALFLNVTEGGISSPVKVTVMMVVTVSSSGPDAASARSQEEFFLACHFYEVVLEAYMMDLDEDVMLRCDSPDFQS